MLSHSAILGVNKPCSDSIDVLKASNGACCGDDECGSANSASCDSQTTPGPTPDEDAVKNESSLASAPRSIPTLPQITPLSSTPFHWGDVDGEVFYADIGKVYEKQVYWRKNIFSSPSGHAGMDYVNENVRLLRA